MGSDALAGFETGLLEVDDLQRANPTPLGAPPTDPAAARVVGRATVVLLSSHFERFVYSLNEQAALALNEGAVTGTLLPEDLRLLHSRASIDPMLDTGWERRAAQLRSFMDSDGWLWTAGQTGELAHTHLLEWMKAPTPQNLVRFFRYWGVPDIFSAITRAVHTRTELWLKLGELVDKRNNIAHGDATTEATKSDIRDYRRASKAFCERADLRMARSVQSLTGGPRPW